MAGSKGVRPWVTPVWLLFLNRYVVGSLVKSGTNCFFKLTINTGPMRATKNVVYVNGVHVGVRISVRA